MQPTFREAVRVDLEALVALLADDALGDPTLPLHEGYVRAFEAIAADPRR